MLEIRGGKGVETSGVRMVPYWKTSNTDYTGVSLAAANILNTFNIHIAVILTGGPSKPRNFEFHSARGRPSWNFDFPAVERVSTFSLDAIFERNIGNEREDIDE
ncbi:hypothetical protein KM043_008501 [Ampulex compressa]|nr:hypothetical protein KM043_008501 [Ampulex compressa]